MSWADPEYTRGPDIAECECKHGLDESWCSICLHHADPPTAETVTILATFAAKYDGYCSECGLPVMVGQMIHRLSNDRYVHKGCE